jgi:DNA repair exonuclease SbcCD ATPase subunit
MQSALQQMREAAADAQNADAAGAAGKGQQAAAALRRAESQMQRATPDAQKRALGDLQLESQQIAQEQRRIAGEAEQLDREGGGTGDARRRLAGDKDHLADRLDALQRSAEALPAAGEAARALAAQRLGARMRDRARQLRDSKAQAPAAQAEQQMADALDRVARTIGAADAGGAKGDQQAAAAQLGGDLDALRDARERVARLERQMRDLQQAGRPGTQQGSGTADLQRQLDQELQLTRDLVSRLQRGDAQAGGRMKTPEEHEWSHSAPGTEAFKQDYAVWQSLAAGMTRALERAESSAAARLSAALTRDRLRAGGSERVPDAYRHQVSRYFEAIAVQAGPGR